MTTANLYNYFTTKEEILYVCQDSTLDRVLDRLETLQQTDLRADKKLYELIRGLVQLFINDSSTVWTLDAEVLPAALRRKAAAKRKRFDAGLKAILDEGIEAGILTATDRRLLTLAIMGAVTSIPQWYDPSGRTSVDTIARTFADYFVNGLRPCTREAKREVSQRLGPPALPTLAAFQVVGSGDARVIPPLSTLNTQPAEPPRLQSASRQ